MTNEQTLDKYAMLSRNMQKKSSILKNMQAEKQNFLSNTENISITTKL